MKYLKIFPLILILLYACEKKDSNPKNIDENENLLVPLFSINKEIAGIGELVTFTNLSDTALTILWNFGDGKSSTDLNPNHKFSSIGRHTIILTAAEVEDTSASKSIEIVDTRIQLGDSYDRVVELYGTNQCLSMNFYLNGISGLVVQYCDPDIAFTFDDQSPRKVISIQLD